MFEQVNKFIKNIICGKKRPRETPLNKLSINFDEDVEMFSSRKSRKLSRDSRTDSNCMSSSTNVSEFCFNDYIACEKIDLTVKNNNDEIYYTKDYISVNKYSGYCLADKDLDYIASLNTYSEQKEDEINFPKFLDENLKKFFGLIKDISVNDELLYEDLSVKSIKKIAEFGQMLNDEVINFYGKMIMERQKNFVNKIFAKVYIFDTYFYTLISNDKSNFQKILKFLQKRQIRLENFEKILIPVLEFNIANNISHWSLVSVNIIKKRIIYYDSLFCKNSNFAISKKISEFFNFYLSDSTKANTPYLYKYKASKFSNNSNFAPKKLFNAENWDDDNEYSDEFESEKSSNENSVQSKKSIRNDVETDNCSEISLQRYFNFFNEFKFDTKIAKVQQQTDLCNGGVFVCKYMDYISRNEPITFDSNDACFYRVQIGVNLVTGYLK